MVNVNLSLSSERRGPYEAVQFCMASMVIAQSRFLSGTILVENPKLRTSVNPGRLHEFPGYS